MINVMTDIDTYLGTYVCAPHAFRVMPRGDRKFGSSEFCLC